MTPIPIGADLSLTATGIATEEGVTVVRPKVTGMERLNVIADAVLSAAWALHSHVFIEGYSYASKFSHAHALGELGGVVRYRLWQIDAPYTDVPPKSLKKFACNNGSATKPDMLDAARRAGYEDSNDDNAVDAWWLRQFGLYVHGYRSVPTFAYRDAVVEPFCGAVAP